MSTPQDAGLLTTAEVSALFRVNFCTVIRWAASGQLVSSRTPGRHYRFYEAEVAALVRGENPEKARLTQGPGG